MRLLRSYFPRNDDGFRHCEEARRGNLFVFSFNSSDYFGYASLVMTMGFVIARRHDVAICLFLVLIMRLLRSYFPRNDVGFVIARRHDVASCLFLVSVHEITASFMPLSS